jgi:shikimate dehydrogenase
MKTEMFPQARSYKSELVGVFGYPVAENPTIVMMEAGFRAAGLDWRYLTLEVPPERLAAALEGLRAFGMQGVNLTIPHKVAVLEHLDEIAEDAALIGAVNTIVRRGDTLRGENTDGKGFLTSLTGEAGVKIEGKRFVVLGAGGAARAITVELALAGASHITVVNRDRDRGRTLVAALNDGTPVKADFRPWSASFALSEDVAVLVNATSIGLFPNVADKPDLDYSTLRPGLIVCDVIPNPPRTAFLAEAENRGAKTLDGLGMLVNQGTIAFKLWTGLDAPVAAMKAALAAEFGAPV